MLTALRIENFAIIDSLEVRFTSGFNVLTGETGAGKSILIDALHLVLGGRARTEVIRTGAEEATVEALFEGAEITDRLSALGLPPGNGELLIRRVINRSGRGRAWVNGAIATVGLLEQLGKGLIDISGQHEHVSLLNPDLHLELLDGYAGLHGDVARYREAFDRYMEKVRERAALAMDDTERSRRLDYLSFQLEEIEKVDPKPGEDETLAQEKKRLSSADRLRSVTEEAERALYSGEESAVERVGVALTRISELAGIDPTLGPAVTSLRTALVELEESARSLGAYSRGIECDPARLSEVEERLEALRRLCRKHGGDLASVLKRRDDMRAERDGISGHGEKLEELTKEAQRREAEARELAKALSAKRQKAAKEFARAVAAELRDLAMGRTTFEICLRPLSDEETTAAGGQGGGLGARGLDACELLISPNPGEDAKPLARIASGGELSRVMLAIKRALARTDPVPTYVFDEVDSGIGGAVAEVVGRLLREVSKERQVLCITHLPQIAALADHHFTVEKHVRGGRTTSRVSAIEEGARTREIARMLAGVEITEAAMRNAEEMLGAARRKRRA